MSLIYIIVGLFGGGISGYLLRRAVAKRRANTVESRAEKLLEEAKTRGQKYLMQAKERALKIIDDAKKEERDIRRDLLEYQKKLQKRTGLFEQKLLEFQDKEHQLTEKTQEIEKIKDETLKIKQDEIVKLEKISNLSQSQAKEELMRLAEDDAKDAILSRARKVQEVGADELQKRARDVLSSVIQRIAASHACETTTSSVDIPNDEMKGRIIGKEGRNIKTIEQLTGTELIVDETPNVITVSGFSPIRRQIAKLALTKLVADGRIQPARIEEAIEESKKELAIEIKKAGEDALFNLGISVAGFDPKLVQILGRLKYRTSYGQNILAHSLEVAHLSGLMAEELGADVALAKKGGLFHDIGKAVDHEVQGNHTEIGFNLLKKFGISDEIAYPALSHHSDSPKNIEAIIVKAADAISGARPGARKETLEQYVQRLTELENVATSFSGVQKAYAIQAGREVRVFVKPQEIDDLSAYNLARDIAKKVEAELRYPGEIRITVIRETRVTEYAK
jgi:ribonuclease Y